MSATRLHLYLVALGVVGIATIFLPFTEDVAPSDVIVAVGKEIFAGKLTDLDEFSRTLTMLASPFCLAIPITAACAKGLRTGNLSRPAWLIVYGFALAMAGTTLGLVGWTLLENGPRMPFGDYLVFSMPTSILVLGTGWIIRNWRRGLPHARNAVIAMQVAYVANGVLCLGAFFGGWQIGAYMTLVTVIVYLAHIALLSVTKSAVAAR